jgi:hypothetical protein
VSNKNKARRRAPASQARTSQAKTSQARAQDGDISQAEADAIVRDVLSKLWEGVASGDPLRAELETATCMAFPYVLGQRDPADIESFIDTVLVKGAVRRRNPDGAALLRLLMTLGTPATRRAASRALAELTGEGIYPPEWVTEIGKVTPGEAWRRYDVFGDDEAIAVTFSYGEAEHGIVVQVDLAGLPVATTIGVSSDGAKLIEIISGNNEEFDRSEQISLAEARGRMLRPLDRAGRDESPKLSPSSIAYLPVAKSRLRRLPEGDGDAGPVYTAADRAAAVEEFMTSPEAAEAVAADEASTRFWAEVLTGYSGRISGESPDQVGPRKLAHILLGLADPADRHRLVAEEFGACTPPPGLTSEEFVEAAYGVVEELWRDEDNPTYQTASRLFADGLSRHDVIHRLAGSPAPTVGSSVIR